ncbi:MAG: hypothetical protein Q4A78_10450 [Peptostreptococcaceae bacterium]|nr:hypothetical protein [Peptostreptococcaceae bacterium]
MRLPKKKSVQRPPSLLSQSLYDISVDCADGTDPFRQSVRYQIFSRQAKQLGLYGTAREEYIRFLRIVYGSLEYGRTDGLSGRSYTDAERREIRQYRQSESGLFEKTGNQST